ncbi:anthranilate synthase component I family protein [Flavihumibacter fluvii]|uniref:anthranilate synthase component I family protein n=1 Tax=Flavihumibacter fluvii TaxID=2838157 RepID=UPI001EFC118B|nr:anthranilate synthase component I family protein [Flavihumibacter fluvii]ULQ52576.1 anthranilate synthase component I family protein [Flavihumibacter fluvii]
MDNNAYTADLHSYECLIATGAWKWIKLSAGNAFPLLNAFYRQEPGWVFGHFGFDLKAETELVPSLLPDHIGFPDCYFFVPEHLILVQPKQVLISSYSIDPATILRQIMDLPLPVVNQTTPVVLKPRIDKETYIQKVNAIKAHIRRGDCYELNFCQEFFASPAEIDPVYVFRSLSSISPNPFSVFYKLDDIHLMCASPERFLRIENGIVRSQPIKGTAARDIVNPVADAELARCLASSEKEKSENVMVVDLVRNDLSRFCKPGSVEVEELFGVYSFPQVHQMISTVKGEIAAGLNWVDAVQQSFPMGSMTGAPKRRVLELIESFEQVRRGIFSGAVGYCTPDGNADFNVVIRSLLYNSTSKYLSCPVGSAITWYADPYYEYEECLLKVAAMRKAVGGGF